MFLITSKFSALNENFILTQNTIEKGQIIKLLDNYLTTMKDKLTESLKSDLESHKFPF